MLENIFSLLFLRHEDLHENVSLPGDLAEEGGHEEDEKRKSLETSFVSTACENISITPSDKLEGADDMIMMSPGTTWSVVDSHTWQRACRDEPRREAGHISSTEPESERVVTTVADVHAGASLQSEHFERSVNQHIVPLKGENSSEATHQVLPPTGYSSSLSVYSMSGYKSGFLCNAFLVRDLLHLLKKSIEEVKQVAAHTSPIAGGDVSDLSSLMSGNVKYADFLKHLSGLSQLVSEAIWRYRLVSDSTIPDTHGVVSFLPLPQDINEGSLSESDVRSIEDVNLRPKKQAGNFW